VDIDGEEAKRKARRCVHRDLVRSVGLGGEFVFSGSYDLSIKVTYHNDFYIGWTLIWFHRFGNEKQGRLSLTLPEATLEEYSVWHLIPRRCAFFGVRHSY
jgi:hypothetical protein